jgi:hypothetical protein
MMSEAVVISRSNTISTLSPSTLTASMPSIASSKS